MVISTLNRNWKSFALAIVGAEYVLRWLPRGTHQWDKFVTPDELAQHLQNNKLAITEQAAWSTAVRPTAGASPPTWTSTTWWWRRGRKRDSVGFVVLRTQHS